MVKEQTCWNEKQLSLLGKIPDTQVSAITGISVSTIYYKRNKLGIGTAPLSTRKPTWNKHYWTEQEINLLGTDTRRNIAKKIGLSLDTIGEKERELGIAPYKPPKGFREKQLPLEIIKLLGTMPELRIAIKAKVSVGTINRARRSRGIPSYRSTKKKKGGKKNG